MREGLGTRLILGVDLTDTWYRFTLWLPGLHPCSLLAKLFILAMPGCTCISCSSWITCSLPSWRWNNHFHTPKYITIQHTQLLPPPIVLLSSFGTWEGQSLHLNQHCVFVGPSLDLLGCLRWYSVEIVHEHEEDTRIGTAVRVSESGKQHCLGNRQGWKCTLQVKYTAWFPGLTWLQILIACSIPK